MLQARIVKNLRSARRAFRLDAGISVPREAGTAVFFGPSGSGKSLAMQCIAGLARPDQGQIRVCGDVMFDSAAGIDMAPQKRRMGYLPQDYALFPHLTVMRNVAYARASWLGWRMTPQARAESAALLRRLGIEELADNYPHEISGGQQQRAAMARALNSGPRLLLLDEPFSALDPLLRGEMRREVRERLDHFGLPAIIITHDPDDVEAFAGSLVFFQAGRCRIAQGWEERRKCFPDAASCVLALQRELFPPV